MQVELELSLPHTPASGTEARTHPSSLKREREGGPRLGESSQDTCVGSQETTTMEKKRVHRQLPSLRCWYLGSLQGREEPHSWRGTLSLRAPSRGSHSLTHQQRTSTFTGPRGEGGGSSQERWGEALAPGTAAAPHCGAWMVRTQYEEC